MFLWISAAILAYFIKGLCGFANTLVFTTLLSFGHSNISISPVELLLGVSLQSDPGHPGAPPYPLEDLPASHPSGADRQHTGRSVSQTCGPHESIRNLPGSEQPVRSPFQRIKKNSFVSCKELFIFSRRIFHETLSDHSSGG